MQEGEIFFSKNSWKKPVQPASSDKWKALWEEQEVAPAKQNETAACPKDKLEFKFF